jgi:anti-repressor protein
MNELIKVDLNSGRPTLSGRDLHEFLEVDTRYNDWFSRMSEYGFTSGIDFEAITQKRVTAQGNETTFADHQITVDMAKEIAMIQRTEKGKQARQYFLEVEKAWNSPEMIMSRALQFSQKTIDSIKSENATLKQVISTQKPKVLFADSVAGSSTSINVSTMAKILNQNGFDIGEGRLYKWLRDNKYLIKEKGRSYNRPTQKSMDRQAMEVRESSRVSANGNNHTDCVTLITGKGQIYFLNKFKELQFKKESANKINSAILN